MVDNGDAVKGKRKRKEVAPFGNYRNYYGYRVGNDVEEDPRFRVFKKEWFEGKDCLDIGCNSGLITINIAKKFHPRTILGIDIDKDRVRDAWWHLQKIARKEKTSNGNIITSKSKVVNGVNELDCSETCSSSPRNDESTSPTNDESTSPTNDESTGPTNDESTSPKNNETSTYCVEKDLLDVISFRSENFVTSWCELPLKHYDTIVCLSVTKWVQLNWGDRGLISFFAKIWRLLHPGGIFVLEPQPWNSYQKNRLTTETTARNYNYILYRPEYFQEILLDKIGFRTVEQATSNISGATMGFDRPVLVFRK